MKILYGRIVAVVFVLLLLGLEAWVHWVMLPPVVESGLLRIGGFAELLVWALLIVLLIGAQIWQLPLRIRQTLTIGLTVWLIAATADLMDEVRVQPLWLSVYMEDVTRVVGMLIVTLALLWLLRHVSRTMQKLEELSMIDPLTGLFNRRMFRHSIDARSEGGFSLILMDLDHFKRVNDRYGHDVGDEVLCQVATALERLCPEHAEVFRLGGEEFAVVSDVLGDKALLAQAERIRRGITELNAAPQLILTLSAGAGTLRRGERYSELMRRVDQALYRVKDSGRNQVMMAKSKAAAARAA